MSASHKQRDATPTPPDHSPVVLLLGTVADTTWRMFTPTIGLCLVGLAVDRAQATEPWFMLAGLIVGVGISTILIVRLLKRVNQ